MSTLSSPHCYLRNTLPPSPWWSVVQRWLIAACLLVCVDAAVAAPFAYLADRVAVNFSVLDIATFKTLVTTPLPAAAGAGPDSRPIAVVANRASGKIFIGREGSLLIIDAATNAITAEVPYGSGPPSTFLASHATLAASPDGKRVYALVPGQINVIDPVAKAVIAHIAVDPSANAMVMDDDGDTLYVSSSGNTSGTRSAAGVTMIDTSTNTVDRFIDTGAYQVTRLAISPDDGYLVLLGFDSTTFTSTGYALLDTTSFAVKRIEIAPSPMLPRFFGLDNLVFNRDGSKIYVIVRTIDMKTIPIFEIIPSTGVVTRVLPIPSGFADIHDGAKMVTSFADDKFILAIFLAEHLHHYPSEPPRRVVFVDGESGTVIKDLSYPSPMDNSYITGDILDVAAAIPAVKKARTTTVLSASTNPPLRPTIPIRFDLHVSGNAPTGNAVFQFAAHARHGIASRRITLPLRAGSASLTLPACDTSWPDHALHALVCSPRFLVVGRYQGDRQNKKSISAGLIETR